MAGAAATRRPHLHIPHPRLLARAPGPHLTEHEHIGFNGWLAVLITRLVGTMWCAYVFAALALISLPDAIRQGIPTTVAWIAQTFLQLVLLSIIMVGQKVAAAASDKQALQSYLDIEAILHMADEIKALAASDVDLTREIHAHLKGKG